MLNADLRTAALMEDDGVMTSEAYDTVKSFIALLRHVDVLCSDSATPEDWELVSQLWLEVGGNLNVLGSLEPRSNDAYPRAAGQCLNELTELGAAQLRRSIPVPNLA